MIYLLHNLDLFFNYENKYIFLNEKNFNILLLILKNFLNLNDEDFITYYDNYIICELILEVCKNIFIDNN